MMCVLVLLVMFPLAMGGTDKSFSWQTADYVLFNWTTLWYEKAYKPMTLHVYDCYTPLAIVQLDVHKIMVHDVINETQPVAEWIKAAHGHGLINENLFWNVVSARSNDLCLALLTGHIPKSIKENIRFISKATNFLMMNPIYPNEQFNFSSGYDIFHEGETLGKDLIKSGLLSFGFSVAYSSLNKLANRAEFTGLVESIRVVIVSVDLIPEMGFPYSYSKFQRMMSTLNESSVVRMIRKTNPIAEIMYELKYEPTKNTSAQLKISYHAFLFQLGARWSSEFKTKIIFHSQKEKKYYFPSITSQEKLFKDVNFTDGVIPINELVLPSLVFGFPSYDQPSFSCQGTSAFNLISTNSKYVFINRQEQQKVSKNPEQKYLWMEIVNLQHPDGSVVAPVISSCDGGIPNVNKELRAIIVYDGVLDITSDLFKAIKDHRKVGVVTLDSVVFPSEILQDSKNAKAVLKSWPKDLKIGCAIPKSNLSLDEARKSCNFILKRTTLVVWSLAGVHTKSWGNLQDVSKQVKEFEMKYPGKRVIVNMEYVDVEPPEGIFCRIRNVSEDKISYEEMLNWSQLYFIRVIPKPIITNGISFSWWTSLQLEKESEKAYSTFPLYTVRGFPPEMNHFANIPCIEKITLPIKPEDKFKGQIDPGAVIYMKIREIPVMSSEELYVTLNFAFHQFSTVQVVPNSYPDVITATALINSLKSGNATGKFIQLEYPLSTNHSGESIQSLLSMMVKQDLPAEMKRGVHFSNWEPNFNRVKYGILYLTRQLHLQRFQIGLLVSNCNEIIVYPEWAESFMMIEHLNYVICETTPFSTEEIDDKSLEKYLDTRFYLSSTLQKLYPQLKVYFRVKLNFVRVPSQPRHERESEITKNYLRSVHNLKEHGRAYNVNYLITAFDSSKSKSEADLGWWKISDYSNLANPQVYTDRKSENFGEAPWRPKEESNEDTAEKSIDILPVSITGGIIIAVLTGLWLVYAYRFHKQKRLLSRAEVQDFLNGVIVSMRSLENGGGDGVCMNYKKEFEVDKMDWSYEMSNILGKGNFAVVYRGFVRGKNVAVKIPHVGCSKQSFLGMLAEVKVMCHLGSHDNVVTFVGCYTKEIQRGLVYIGTEICENGCLLNNLRSRAEQEQATASTDVMSELVKFSFHIASGMEYISEKKVIHGDLAARNVLLDSYNVCKIGDFGLSRKLYEYNKYVKKSQEPLPWKWMAYEALTKREFSSESDVWSYGVTLWEIFSLGQVPYPGLNWTTEFGEELRNGMRMTKPQFSTEPIFKNMLECWELEVKKRPTFSQLKVFFFEILEAEHSQYDRLDG